MSNFKVFAGALNQHVAELCVGETHLFKTEVSKDELWDTYLNSFPEGTNEIFKERREYDCVYCSQFLRPCGNVVAIKDDNIITIWDIEGLEHPFDVVAKAMSDLVRSRPIENVFVTRDSKLGTASNKQILEDKTVLTWNHFHMTIPKNITISRGTSPESVMAEFRASKEVFERSLKELSKEAIDTVLELIAQGSLYKGEENRKAVVSFLKYKIIYDALTDAEKDAWLWKESIGNPVSKIRNTAIGQLLINVSEDMDLDEAVRKFEHIVAPTNYKRPKAIFTKRMVAEAETKIVELGMLDSLGRRHARLDDITVNNVLFVNRDAREKMEGGNLFDTLKESSEGIVNPKNFNKVEEISVADFLKNVIPDSKRVELLIEGGHQKNLMSLVAPQVKSSKSMFKWGNGFSWSYCSDTADSMRSQVEKAGGDVSGVLRFSIRWNDDRGKNNNDYDAHCIEPGRNLISFKQKSGHQSGGNLDIDIRVPGDKVAVENITWPSTTHMREGIYTFLVHNYAHRGGDNGFDAEIEFDGQLHSFSYHKDLKHKETVVVAKVEYTRQNGFRLVESLASSMSVREVWGITTNKWVDVSTIMYSPNYWDEQKGIGNRHYFFILKGCLNDSSPRGFYNEFLKEELNVHRKVFEALGSKARVEDSSEQLSGVGFSDTQRNEVFVRVEGAFTRVLKVLF